MNGFEYQVAGHMIWEGMVQEGLAVTRAVHDRYHASKRNPWNEVECGDHYARSMASYGVFIAACGFEYHGPKQHIGFAPKLTPENFKAAFTAAEGWGSLSQSRTGKTQINRIEVKWGGLRLKTLAFELPPGTTLKAATVSVGTQQTHRQSHPNRPAGRIDAGQGSDFESQGNHHHKTRIRVRGWLNIHIPATVPQQVAGRMPAPRGPGIAASASLRSARRLCHDRFQHIKAPSNINRST